MTDVAAGAVNHPTSTMMQLAEQESFLRRMYC